MFLNDLTRHGQWSSEQLLCWWCCRSWFHRMASIGLPRKYRATESSRHTLEQDASQELQDIFFSDSVWSLIDPALRTERFQHDTFSLLSCIRCVMTDALFEPHDSFPIRAFQWLGNPDGIAAAVRDEPCHRAFDLCIQTWVRFWSTDGRSLESAFWNGCAKPRFYTPP